MNKGFTLFELLILIVIIGILASIAIPSYCDYLPRVKISESISQVMQSSSRKISDYAKQNKHLPEANNAILQLTENDKKLIESVAWYPDQSLLLVSLSAKRATSPELRYLAFIATGTNDNLQWKCTNQHALLDDKHKPMENKYLPYNCRSDH